MRQLRADRIGSHKTQFEKNKKRILATQDICGICGKPVDKSLKFPHPIEPICNLICNLRKDDDL